MPVLSADRNFTIQGQHTAIDGPMVASDIIYKGALLSYVAAGHVAPLTAAEVFAGVAEAQVDNASGSAGDKTAQFINEGEVIISGQSGFAISDVGSLVYGSDDATLTTTSASNTLIGVITKFHSASKIQVKLLHVTA